MKREGNYDVLRILATVAVIFIHVNAIFFVSRSAVDNHSIEYVIESMINIVTRYSVPAFVMISGAFVLNDQKNMNISAFYKKTGYKITLYFLGALFLILIADEIFIYTEHGNMLSPLILIAQGVYYNYWYMFMLMGLYILTPFIILIKQNISLKTYYGIGVFTLLWACGSQATTSYNISYSMGVVFAFVSYYVGGDILYTVGKSRRLTASRRLLYFFVIGVLWFVTYFARYIGVRYYMFNAFVNFFSPTIILYSLIVFSLFTDWRTKIKVQWFSKYMFGVYLFHSFVIRLFQGIIIAGGEKYGEVVTIFVSSIVIFVVSLLVSIIYDRIWIFLTEHCKLRERWESLRIWEK